MSFANQALAAQSTWRRTPPTSTGRCTSLPPGDRPGIAELKLETMGIAIDELTAEQAKYLSSWDQGT